MACAAPLSAPVMAATISPGDGRALPWPLMRLHHRRRRLDHSHHARCLDTVLVAVPADARTLEQWAAWANLAPRTLSRRFAVETGMRLTAWRQRVRLLRSLELLAAGLPVTTVAFDLGYANVSAVIALFRRTFGTTPGRYFAVGFKSAQEG